MRLKRHLLSAAVLAAVALAIVVAPEALAQNFGLENAAGGVPKPKDLATVIGNVLKAVLGLVATLFLLLMIYAGFTWMTARGDSKKVDTAKQLISSAIIGVIIIASAYAITDFVIKAATGSQSTPKTERFSVPIGGACTQSGDCAGTGVCTDGKCTEANFGSCVNNKVCTIDDDCGGTNGGCFSGVCSCDAIP